MTSNKPSFVHTQFDSTDFYLGDFHSTKSVFENLGEDFIPLKKRKEEQIESEESNNTLTLKHLYKAATGYQVTSIVFLSLLGILCTCYGTTVDFCIGVLLKGIMFIKHSPFLKGRDLFSELASNYLVSYLLWILYSLFFAFLSVSCVKFISANSTVGQPTFTTLGSGIPEMKSILSGIVMNQYLEFKTFIAKTLGLICAFAAGLSIGKEGPLCHLGSCIAYLLMQLKCFKRLYKNDFIRQQMYAAACAAGVVATFGAPFGGVIFSIEVTSTYYPVSTLWRSIWATLFATLMFSFFRFFQLKTDIEYTDFDEIPYKPGEYVLFAILGVLGGLVGALMVYLVGKFTKIRQESKFLQKHKYFIVLAVTLLTAAVSFPIDPLLKTHVPECLGILFGRKDPDVHNYFLQLTLFVIAKTFLTAIAVVLPIPAGVFVPNFVLGAGLGRWFGEICKRVLPFKIDAAGYAVAGAGAVAGGVTRTLSTAVIVYEITGQLHFLVPVMLSTTIATFVGNMFGPSIFDKVLHLRGLPQLTKIRNEKNYLLTAKQLMRKNLTFLTTNDTVPDIIEILKTKKHVTIPLVDSKENMILLGAVHRAHIEKIASDYLEAMKKIEKEDDIEKKITESKKQVLFVTKSQSTNSDLSGKVQTTEEKDSIMLNDATILEENEVNMGDETPRPSPRDLSEQTSTELTRPTIEYDPAPYILPAGTPAGKLHFIFSMLGISHAYVIENGKLVGVVVKKDLIAAKL